MKLTTIFFSANFLLFSTLCFSVDFAQAQEFPESHMDFLSSASHAALSEAASADIFSSTIEDRSGSFGLSKIGKNVGPNVQVNDPQLPFPDGLLGRSETTIASDPSGQRLVVGWNDPDGFCGPPFNAPCRTQPATRGLSGFGFSSDGGQTWTDGGAPFVFGTSGGGVVTRGDPWMDTGGPGQNTYYYANIAIFINGFSAGVSVHRGNFTGPSFAFNQAVLIPAPKPTDFLDKEALCAGKTSETEDLVAVSVTNVIEVGGIPGFGFGQIEGYFSNDRASSFPTRTIIQADETIDVPSNRGIINQGSTCAIARDGKIYVVWERGFLSPAFGQGAAGVFPQIVFARSDDGGQTFGSRVLVSDISSGSFFPPSGYNRSTTNDFPRISVVTNKDDRFFGRIYVVYQDSRIANGGPQPASLGAEDFFGVDLGHPDTDIYLRFSDDGGDTWSKRTLVAGRGDGKIQFWPVVSSNQSDGTVDVTWYESEEPEGTDFLNGAPPFGDKDSFVDVFYAGSKNGGRTFRKPIKVTEVTTNWNRNVTATNIRPNFGDYIFHVSTPNRVMVTWADGRNGVPDVFYATIGAGELGKEGAPLASLVPTPFSLKQNYPNPFNPETEITFALPEDSHVTLKLYDILGREVALLAEGDLSAGQHRINLNAKDLPSGVYIYNLTAGNLVDTKKMILLK